MKNNEKLPGISKVAVFYGGWSHETEHIVTFNHVLEALDKLKTKAKAINVNDKSFISELINFAPDVVFLTNQGAYGEDGKLQGLLEILGFAYTGSGVCASAIGMNKYISKLLFMNLGLNVPTFLFLNKHKKISYHDAANTLGTPFIIKPVMTGSSFGINIIYNQNDFNACAEETTLEYGDCLLEEFIDGDKIEYSTGILEDDEHVYELPICKSILKTTLYSFENKFGKALNQKVIDPELNSEHKIEILHTAKKVHTQLGCSGLSRTDMIIGKNGLVYTLEFNTIPGLLPTSIFPQICEKAGFAFHDIVAALLKNALKPKPMEISKLYPTVTVQSVLPTKN